MHLQCTMSTEKTPLTTFSNPRLEAVFNDWPLGGSKRGGCTFTVLTDQKKGTRISRVTENPKSERLNKPKFTTYHGKAAIVDGDDGRTYILQHTGSFIYIWRSDFLIHGTVWPKEEAFYKICWSLIEEANK